MSKERQSISEPLDDIKYTLSTSKRKTNWPLVISLISVSLALFSFFFQNLRTTHSLKACVNGGFVEEKGIGDYAEKQGMICHSFKAVFHNYGNKHEAIVQTRVHYTTDSTDPRSGYSDEVGEPFVIKPGEAVLKEYYDTVAMENYLAELPPAASPPAYYVYLEYFLTGKKGELFTRYQYITRLDIDTVNGDMYQPVHYKPVRCDELVN